MIFMDGDCRVSFAEENPSPAVEKSWNVLDFGAVGDGVTDCTAAFQTALNTAAKSGPQTVFAPRGNYLFNGNLSVPTGVTLKGVWESVPAHNGLRDRGLPKPTDDGTTFLVAKPLAKEPVATEQPTTVQPVPELPFLTLTTNSTLKGVCIYYPDQISDGEPEEYPWTIVMRGKNPAVLDCELLNPYKGIDTTGSERHLIRNISGQPLRMGIYVDAIFDIGRIENVHFNPWWSLNPRLRAWQLENGEAFVFGMTDWQYVLNTFCFGYKVGYKFIKTTRGSGVANGNFLGIGADNCTTAVLVENCAPMGLLITNGEFVSFNGPDPTMIRVLDSNRGVVRFANCAFWGPCHQIANVAGNGTVGFSDCTFVQWGFRDMPLVQGGRSGGRVNKERVDVPAIEATGGILLVRGCDFQDGKTQLYLGKDLKKAVISDNVVRGRLRIMDETGRPSSVGIANNIAD